MCAQPIREGVHWRNDRVWNGPITGRASYQSPQARAGQRVPAGVAELVDALDLGSSGVTRESSSLSFRTSSQNGNSSHIEIVHKYK